MKKIQKVWVKIEGAPPKCKNHSSICYNEKVYLYGGFDGESHSDQLHVLDCTSWAWSCPGRQGQLPTARNGHSATLYKAKMIVIGGWNGTFVSTTEDIHILDLETLMWQAVRTRGECIPCNMHTADVYMGRIYIFRGGDGCNSLNDLHVLNMESFEIEPVLTFGQPPSPRVNHSSTISTDFLYIFGGWNGIERLDDLLRLDLLSLEWQKIRIISESPTPRTGMSLNSISGSLYLFGGSGISSSCYSDLFCFNNCTLEWTKEEFSSCPSVRADHTATVLNDRKIVVIGGSYGRKYRSSVYVLNLDPAPIIPDGKLSGNLLEHISSLFNNPEFSDIEFSVENRTIYAHKVVVTRLSAMFHRMFTGNFREKNEKAIIIEKVSYRVFYSLIKFLYIGNTGFIDNIALGYPLDYFLELLQCADRYLIEPVKVICENIISRRINEENVVLIRNAIDSTSAEDLKSYCDWFIRSFS